MPIACSLNLTGDLSPEYVINLANKYKYLSCHISKLSYKRKDGWVIFAVHDVKLTDLFSVVD